MMKLLHDRYLPIDGKAAWDIATGAKVVLRSSERERHSGDRPAGIRIDWGATPDGGEFEAWELHRTRLSEPSFADLEPILEALDVGRDGEPRSLNVPAREPITRMSFVRAIAREARRRGYVPVCVGLFATLRESLGEDFSDRVLVLLAGDQESRRREGPDALVHAASMSARPHLLISLTGTQKQQRQSLVRETETTYSPQIVRSHSRWTASQADVARYQAIAERAMAAARRGRHAEAERGLREAVTALARRHAWDAATLVGITLGRLLLERGRASAADRIFRDAATGAEKTDSAALMTDARVWMALARVDAARLTEAEALLRATKLTLDRSEPWRRAWVDASLARCLLWQRRGSEALELIAPASLDWLEGPVDALIAASTLAVHIRVLVDAGRAFEAGQRARRSLALAGASTDAMARLIALVSHLRVLATTGDLYLTQCGFEEVAQRARELHAPLRALRAHLIWIDALMRAGRAVDARREGQRVVRLARAAPPLLRRHIEQRGANAMSETVGSQLSQCVREDLTIALLRMGQEEPDETAVLSKIAGCLLDCFRASRVEFQAGSSAVASTIAAVGGGLMPRLAGRALEAGIPIGPERVQGVWEAAWPVRAGARVVGAVACRWPIERTPPAQLAFHLDVAAAVAAPWLEALLAARQDAARAAVEIPELVGHSASMMEVRRAVARAASAPFAVLVIGESGTGKELVARAIHKLSARRDRPFCDVNCAALPDDLVESELFGHARGAFTGASVERRGLFEEATGGTLFLDELPDLSPRAQAKLLRVVQQGEVRRIGEAFVRKVDVRLVTASNRSMTEEVSAGRFRRDLLYRLDVIRIRLPALRERPEDVPTLAKHFWQSAAARAGTRATLSHAVIADLANYHWPGNVRELQNVMAALAVAAPGRGLVRSSLLPAAITGVTAVTSVRLDDARRQFERRFVETALARAGGSRSRAAAQLGLSRQGLLKVLARLGLETRADRDAGET